MPNTDLTITEASHHSSPLVKSCKFKSVSDTKLHKLNPTKQGLVANLANFPDLVKNSLTKRSRNKCNVEVVHKDYLPLPLDAPRDSEEDYDFEDDAADSRDLLDEKEMRKSTSCCIQ